MIIKKKLKYINYLDKNNLYSYAISKYLPMDKFKCLDPAKINLDKYDDLSLKDCILEVNLEDPIEFYKMQHVFPLATDKAEIT